jgi:hypothetical protein
MKLHFCELGLLWNFFPMKCYVRGFFTSVVTSLTVPSFFPGIASIKSLLAVTEHKPIL